MICGADDWVSIQEFLELPNGIPSHETFGRVFGRLDPDQFQTCFTNWILSVSELTKGQVVAIDGKTLRRSHDKTLGKGAIVMVSAWATADHLLLTCRHLPKPDGPICACRGDPLTVRGKGDAVDPLEVALEDLGQFAGCHGPQPGRVVVASRNEQGAIGGEGQAIDPSLVAFEGRPGLALGHVPQGDGVVAGAGGQQLAIGREGQAVYPARLVVDGLYPLSRGGVPEDDLADEADGGLVGVDLGAGT